MVRDRGISPDRRAAHAAVEDPQVVVDAALRFLELRQRSVAEVRRRLTRSGYRSDLIAKAIERLSAVGVLDDDAFARGWVESRDRAHPRGERALRAELYRKGVDADVVARVLADREIAARERVSPDRASATAEYVTLGGTSADERAAIALLERRRGALARVADPRLRRQRAYALLARAGIDPDIAARVSAAFVLRDGEPHVDL